MRLFTTDDLFSYANYDLDKWTNTVVGEGFALRVVQHGFLPDVHVQVA